MRETPLFGYDTIRKFANNVSEMKKMAARDYEDILQASFSSSMRHKLILIVDNNSRN
jgi:hypothetical protein